MSNSVYAVLHIPTGEYVTLKHRKSEVALCEDTIAANKLISLMTGDTSFYWGAPRIDYEIGKTSLLEYDLPPDAEEFDIVGMPKDIINEDLLKHTLKLLSYNWITARVLDRIY